MPERRWTEGPMGLSHCPDGGRYALVAKMPERVAEIFAKVLNQWSLSPEQEAKVCEAIQHQACEGNADAVHKFIQYALEGSAAAEKPEPQADKPDHKSDEPGKGLWRASAEGLCFAGETGCQCVVEMAEDQAKLFAEILNELSVVSPDGAAHLIRKGYVSPTKECLEDALFNGLMHYPLEPREADVLTSGRSLADYESSAAEIPPRDNLFNDDKVGVAKLKPKAAADKLRVHLDDLHRLSLKYDLARGQGKLPLDPNYPPGPPSGHENLLMSLGLMRNHISYSKTWAGALIESKPFLAGDLTEDDRRLLTIPDSEADEEATEVETGGTADEADELWADAVRFVAEKGQASTAMLQRRFSIGFQRAQQLLESMERRGIVGPQDGPRPRAVLIDTEQACQQVGQAETDDDKSERIVAEHDRRQEARVEKFVDDVRRALGEPSDAIPAEINVKVPMSGKALKVILSAAAAKPGKDEPEIPIHSVGIGKHSVCATDQFKVVVVGPPEKEYSPTVRKEALVEASSSDIRSQFVHWDEIELMRAAKEGEKPPTFPDVAKLCSDVDQMVDVGSFSPTLLVHVAKIAEALGANEVKLFRSKGKTSYLGFKGQYWPSQQLDLFSGSNDPVPFCGLLAGRNDRELEVEDIV